MFDFAHSLSVFLLAQADVERDMFQWGRIHQNTDWILPLLVVGLMFLYIYRIYKKDAVETARPLRWLLRALRCIAVLALLVMYLQPQWRHEKESTIPSRAVIFVDSSLSMAIADQPADRYQSAEELRDALLAAVRRPGTAQTAPGTAAAAAAAPVAASAGASSGSTPSSISRSILLSNSHCCSSSVR